MWIISLLRNLIIQSVDLFSKGQTLQWMIFQKFPVIFSYLCIWTAISHFCWIGLIVGEAEDEGLWRFYNITLFNNLLPLRKGRGEMGWCCKQAEVNNFLNMGRSTCFIEESSIRKWALLSKYFKCKKKKKPFSLSPSQTVGSSHLSTAFCTTRSTSHLFQLEA